MLLSRTPISVLLHTQQLLNSTTADDCTAVQTNQTINQSINQSTNQPINQSTNQPIIQSTNQPINHSVNQATNQPSNQSVNSHLLTLGLIRRVQQKLSERSADTQL